MIAQQAHRVGYALRNLSPICCYTTSRRRNSSRAGVREPWLAAIPKRKRFLQKRIDARPRRRAPRELMRIVDTAMAA
jgi:hypothetical protein